MSSIPAAKERLAKEADFDDAAWPAALERLRHTEPGTDDQGIAIVGTRDLEMALIRLRQFADVALGNAIEISRLEQENAKLRAERDEVLTALKIAEAYAHHAIDHAIHHAPRERADLAKADQALIAVLVGFALVEAIVIGLQGQGLKKAHDRLREYADTIRALKEKLEQPRAPKGWTHG